jgi:hypothetical protein
MFLQRTFSMKLKSSLTRLIKTSPRTVHLLTCRNPKVVENALTGKKNNDVERLDIDQRLLDYGKAS